MKKIILVLTLLLLAPCMAIYADTIRLKNFKEDIEGKIIELTQDYIGIIIPEKDIKSVTIQPNVQQAYPDLVSLLPGGVKIECKVTSINTGNIGIRLPKSEVAALHMIFAPEVAKGEKQAKTVREFPPQPTEEAEPLPSPIERIETPVPPAPVSRSPAPKQSIKKEKAGTLLSGETVEDSPLLPQVSRKAAKEKIKRDVIQELEAEKTPEEEVWSSPQAFKDEIKRELKEELEATREAEEKAFQETNLGRVEGRLSRRGEPLPDCEVKIVMLVKAKIPFTAGYYHPELPTEYEGVTDEEGYYHLTNVAPGEYKMYWKPPGETGWIRRAATKPDVIVEAGKTTYPKDIETLKYVVR